jgi:two-component system LytT family response regulator/two-component system response regulator LytT
MDLRTLVVDDEQLARDELGYLLGRLGGVEVIGQAGNGVEALAAIGRLRPDIVFLDVQMPGLTGFEVARQMLESRSVSHIIFVTAYDQYAIEAFEVNAVDYLLKPVDPARLELAIQRARRRLDVDRLDREMAPSAIIEGELAPPLAEGRGARAHGSRLRKVAPGPAEAGAAATLSALEEGRGLSRDQLEKILELVAERQGRRDRLAIRVGERFLLVQADEIIHASLADESIAVATSQYVGTSNYRTLDELQARLDPQVFWRVHRSHLVNINKIKEIVPWFSRNYILRMKDEKSTEIPVSRTQTRRLREYLKL